MRDLSGYLLKRLVWMLLTLWAVFSLSFILMRRPRESVRQRTGSGTGDPASIGSPFQHGRHAAGAVLAALGNLVLRGDLGWSMKLEDYSVAEVIAEGFPISASLAIFALVFAIILGVSAGVISAIRRGSIADVGMMSAAVLGIAIPNFVLASLAILLFVFLIPIFPAAGWGTFRQILLPAMCLGLPVAAYIARLTRTGMLEVMGRDYVRTAAAKGLSKRAIVLRHTLPGALLPVVSYLGPATASVLTGSLVLEKILRSPGWEVTLSILHCSVITRFRWEWC